MRNRLRDKDEYCKDTEFRTILWIDEEKQNKLYLIIFINK